MRANLYIHKDSFKYNGVDSEKAFAMKFNAFADDIADILMSKSTDDVFYSSFDLVECEVFKDTSFSEAIEKYADNDKKGILYTLFANTSELLDTASLDELQERCYYHSDETEVNSIVFLNYAPEKPDNTRYITFDRYEIVYDKSSWLFLRRQILGNHPGTPSEFIGDCRLFFPNICFHNQCVVNLVDDKFEYLKVIPRKIVYYLSCLNDGFMDILEAHKDKAPDANSILEDFSSVYGLEAMGSLQRDMTKKDLLTFRFTETITSEKRDCMRDVLCEPHLKISSPDSNYRGNIGEMFNPRIYFSFGEKGVENDRILVGSIGKHIA